MPLKVLLASRIFAPEAGAAAYRLGSLVRALEEAGHEVKVLTTKAPGARHSGAGISRWPVLRDRGGAVRGYLQYASFDLPLFFRLLFAQRYDVLVVEPPPTTGVVARLASVLRRRPYVYFSADVSSTAAEGIGVTPVIVRLLRQMERWVLRGAVAILSVSPGVTVAVRAVAGNDVPVAEVGTGVDTEVFSISGPIEEKSAKTFVYAGTMSEIQGAGIFIDAFLEVYRTHPEAQLLMYGQGVELEQLQRRAAPAGDQIRFLGNVPGAEVATALRSSCAGLASVRPSRGYDFAFATKALASLACGAPVVYAGVGPMAALIRDNHLGWAVGWNSAEVAEAMAQALAVPSADADRRRIAEWTQTSYSLTAVGRKAAEAVENFTSRRF